MFDFGTFCHFISHLNGGNMHKCFHRMASAFFCFFSVCQRFSIVISFSTVYKNSEFQSRAKSLILSENDENKKSQKSEFTTKNRGSKILAPQMNQMNEMSQMSFLTPRTIITHPSTLAQVSRTVAG